VIAFTSLVLLAFSLLPAFPSLFLNNFYLNPQILLLLLFLSSSSIAREGHQGREVSKRLHGA